ncbi:MAG: hypothetical protein ABFC96_01745 [Thermoguttaceae bacterium]
MTPNEIKRQFLAWSGGFSPESDYQIYTYIDVAAPLDTSDDDTRLVLHTWMNEPTPGD